MTMSAAECWWERQCDRLKAENADLKAENARLRERCAKTLEVGTRWMAKAARFESENAALRELCRRYGEYISQDRCEGCVYKMRCNNGWMDECWQLGKIRDLASELGVEAE